MFLIKRNTPRQRPLGSRVIALEQNLNLSLYGERKPVTLIKNGHKAAHGYYMITPQNASHPGVSSPRLLYRSENFTPVRNFAPVSRKRETSVFRWARKGSACVMLAILNCKCILSTYLQIAEI